MFLASATLLKIFGVDESKAPDDAELEFTFTNLPQSWAVFIFLGGAAVLVWLSFWLYRREKSDASTPARIGLAVIRSIVFVLLFFVLLGPSVTYTQSQSLQPVIAVLRDASRSMGEVDNFRDEAARKSASEVIADPGSMPRSKIIDEALLGNDASALRAIARKGRLRLLDFGAGVNESATSIPDKDTSGADRTEEGKSRDLKLPLPLTANSPVTDLAGAIEEGLRDKLTSAVFVVTDGQHNGSTPIDEAVAAATKRGIPLFFAGVGDPIKPQNITVAELYADPQTWKGDPFEIQAKVYSQGLAGELATAQLVSFPDPDESEAIDPLVDGAVLEESTIELPEDGAPLPVVFSHKPEEPGSLFLSIRVLPLDNESTIKDNAPQQPVPVEVLDDRARVLLISGNASWEYRALLRFLLREETIDLASWLQDIDQEMPQRGNTILRNLPASREELFAFDVIIMIDPAPYEFSSEWFDLLEEFVDSHAGGLLYMPGPVNSGTFLRDPRSAGIARLLPVELGDVGDMEVAALLASNTREWPLQIVSANLDHPIMRFFTARDANESAWRGFPGLFWSFPAQNQKPGARTLIEHSDPALRIDENARPLIVSGYLGGGRTVFLGIDGTWRWRSAGYDSEFFHRFWVQAIRYLAEGRALAGKRRGSIDSARNRYLVGDRVQLTARLRQATFEPLAGETVAAELIRPGEEAVPLQFSAVPNEPGTFQTSVAAETSGEYRVAITLEDGEQVTIDTRFRAELPIRETRDTWLDRDLLQRLAKETGGSYFEINQLDQLAAALPNRIRRLENRSQPIPLWDTSRVLGLLIVLLGIEWALRKRLKML